MELNFLDLFAGAGGLSEGFIQAGFTPIAHIEMDEAASNTLKTRMAYHWLKNNNLHSLYLDYLNKKITRDELYQAVPHYIINSVINKEISDDTINEIFKIIDKKINNRKIDIIIGGPPCQAYSLVGRSRDKNKMKGDKRNYLYRYYVRFLEKYKPKYFVFENVVGLLSAKDQDGKKYLDSMKECFNSIGYSVEIQVLNAKDYGVPQNRRRVILIGKHGNHNNFYPSIGKNISELIIDDILFGLPIISAGGGKLYANGQNHYNCKKLDEIGIKDENVPVTMHQARSNNDQDLKIYRIAVEKWNDSLTRLNYNDLPEVLKTHKNRTSFIDRFKVVVSDYKASHTIVAHIAKDGHHYIHPDLKQNRSITPREAARLQTFPDNYVFESVSKKWSRTQAYKQIGNAVPVLLAKRIADSLKENW